VNILIHEIAAMWNTHRGLEVTRFGSGASLRLSHIGGEPHNDAMGLGFQALYYIRLLGK
jgi:hypothetical protein